jgi:ketosteroid isomerase-like protein
MKALTTLFMIGMFATAVAMADDVDDVKAAVESYFAALNSGNGAAMARYRIPEYSVFAGGGLIDRSSSTAQQRDDFQALADAGRKLNLRIQHLDVRVYGNAAVVTGYLMGIDTAPDGTVSQSRQQRTGVWIKQGGQWKEVHRHASRLFPQ